MLEKEGARVKQEQRAAREAIVRLDAAKAMNDQETVSLLARLEKRLKAREGTDEDALFAHRHPEVLR